jgi:hypothetical protein
MTLRFRTLLTDQLHASHSAAKTGGSGVVGNERITAMAGAALFVLLAAEGVTILQVRSLFPWHAFIGVMLVGPLAVKLSSTGYRFVRYYTGTDGYRAKGPPQPLLRLLAPILVASTVAVVGTGLALLAIGPGSTDTLVALHKASFIVWFAVTTMHVLFYVWRVPGLLASDWSPARAPGSWSRLAIAAGGVGAGALAAVLALPAIGTWTTWYGAFHR